jgi:CheY-like chemotaxis protein
MDRDTFARLVSQALIHFHDRPYLERHTLVAMLVDQTAMAPAAKLQRVLRAAIEEFSPDPDTPEGSPVLRRYRHLILRYIEGVSLEETARQLLVGVRQAHRDHAEAFYLLTSSLWARCARLEADRAQANDVEQVPTLDTEVLRVTAPRVEQPPDLAAVIDGAVAMLAPFGRERNMDIQSIPPDSPIRLPIGAVVLRHIVLDLLSYALESPATSIIRAGHGTGWKRQELRVTITPRCPPAGAAETTADSEREMLLATAQRLVEMNGGTILVKHTQASTQEIVISFPSTDESTLLIVDDNLDIGRLFRRYLHGQQYRLVQATNAEQARRLAHDLNPSVIILDLLMPSVDGWEILRQIRRDERTQDTPVIVCSVLPEWSLAKSLGIVDFLIKPVTSRQLRATLQRWCEEEHQVRRLAHPSHIAMPRQPSDPLGG